MFINPISVAVGAVELFRELTHHNKDEKKGQTQLVKENPDVNNMSFDDLKSLTMNLVQKGSLSEQDGASFLAQLEAIQKASGIAKDAKIDMMQLYEQQLRSANVEANAKEVASIQQSLSLLQGIKARSGAQIPQAV